MSNLVQNLQKLAGNLYGIATRLGVCENPVSCTIPAVQTRNSDGTFVETGTPLVMDFPTAIVAPAPNDQQRTERWVQQMGGLIEVGDIIINNIPRSNAIDAICADPRGIWTISGPNFLKPTVFRMADGFAHKDLMQWTLILKRTGR